MQRLGHRRVGVHIAGELVGCQVPLLGQRQFGQQLGDVVADEVSSDQLAVLCVRDELDEAAGVPDADGLTDRQRALLSATDEFVVTRSLSEETWAALSSHLDRRQLIEFCMLAGQYDTLAATMTTLRIPPDFPQ